MFEIRHRNDTRFEYYKNVYILLDQTEEWAERSADFEIMHENAVEAFTALGVKFD